MIKRTFDIIVAALSLLLLSPLMLLAALIVKLSSPGPVFFRQIRVGRGFRPFEIVKFRTMVQTAPSVGPPLTTATDPRVTRPGWWLRMSKIDELPQLWNVLKGDMSLVGPRPEIEKYVTRFRHDYEELLQVRPGLTDLASIRFRSEEAVLATAGDPEQAYVTRLLPLKIELAREYVHRASFFFDLGILIRTFAQIFMRGGSPDLPPVRVAHDQSVLVVYTSRIAKVSVQLALVVLSNYLALLLRFGGQPPPWAFESFISMLPTLVMLRGLIFVPFRLYQGLWRYTSVFDLLGVIGGIAASSLAFLAVTQTVLGAGLYPRSVVLIDAVLLAVLLSGLRAARRVSTEMMQAPAPSRRILVYGAGNAGAEAVREMKQNRLAGYRPVGFIDDDPRKRGLRIHGVRVLGARADVNRIVRRVQPAAVLIAISHLPADVLRDARLSFERHGIPVKTLPKLREILDGGADDSRITGDAVEGLIARSARSFDDSRARQLLAGRRVLVAGAGGVVGAELCRRILRCRPSQLVLLDRHETSLTDVTQELRARPGSGAVVAAVCDVTNAAAIERLMTRHAPEVVFHAAFQQDPLLMLENSCEAVRNNVCGTRVLLSAAERARVDRVILLSSTMAADPTGIAGATMRAAEMIAQDRATASGTSFVSVRFGPVFGRRTGVAARLLAQIKRGGPVTVTHPDARMRFIDLSEAAHLVLEAAAVGAQSGIFVVTHGQLLKVADVARKLIRLAGLEPERDIAIEFTHPVDVPAQTDEMSGADEATAMTAVEGILRIKSGGCAPASLRRDLHQLEDMVTAGDADGLMRTLRAMTMPEAPVRSAAPDETEAAVAAAAPAAARARPGRRCPRCRAASVRHVRARGVRERVRKIMTTERPHQCLDCSWRGWLEPSELKATAWLPPPPAVDLTALDTLADGPAPGSDSFIPRNLE